MSPQSSPIGSPQQGQGTFPPLPRQLPKIIGFQRLLDQGTLEVNRLRAGSIGVGQYIQSFNYSAGTAGWHINGDGNAEFNNIVVRGDIESSNWDGASPANLASEDGTATAGFYLDSSVGSAQFEGDIFLGGELTGGTLTGGLMRTSATGNRIELGPTAFAGQLGLVFRNGSGNNVDGAIYLDTGNSRFNITAPGDYSNIFFGGNMILQGGNTFEAGGGAQILGDDGGTATRAAPAFAFTTDSDTGLHRNSGGNALELIGGGQVQLTTGNATNAGILVDNTGNTANITALGIGGRNTGWYRSGNDVIYSRQNTVHHQYLANGVGFTVHITTAAAANAFIDTGANDLLKRSTSSLKYKPDWAYAEDAADVELPTPIRWTDERGQVRLGFGAEHVHEAVPEAYEEEVYDLRSLVAVLSEKIKRLETACA